MSQLPTLISDLALILICAGIMTLLFKKLKQPLVLGYIVAGFLASPHMPYTPSVFDTVNIKTWADIGVIFLLFALGLEFSFKKIVKVGGSAVIAALTIIAGMIMLGIAVGMGFGWEQMDSLFLGGMIAMSSTTIIYKAFDDLKLREKQFTGLVLSILILEDILAIALMVILSTLAVRNTFEGVELLSSLSKLVFFLIVWFVIGIFLIPAFLRKCRKLMNDETLLIVALGLCFGMVVMAAQVGFSPAFGAFVIGSILAETVDAEAIDRLVKPVKDLFGAIFFVSVGMMVDPQMIVEYALPIVVITLTVILGQAFFGTLGVTLAGKSVKTALQCGFSLTQIGEFAFIIASLGVSLHVTSDFLYPIVVAVSVITTFITPYMIRLAEPTANYVDKHMPRAWRRFAKHYLSGSQTVNHESVWRKLIIELIRITIVYSIVSIFTILILLKFVTPFIEQQITGIWGEIIGSTFVILCVSPFLRSIMIKKNHSIEFKKLWEERTANRVPLVATIVLRVVWVAGIVIFILSHFFKASIALITVVASLVVIAMIASRRLKKQSIMIERQFIQNLRCREIRDEHLGKKRPAYAGHLLSRDMHMTDFVIPEDSPWASKTLSQLRFGQLFGIHIVSILRGHKRINIPGGSVRLFPLDKIQVLGSDEELKTFGKEIEKNKTDNEMDQEDLAKREVILKLITIDENSEFLDKQLRDSNIREKYHCMVAGIEREDETLISPEGDRVFTIGDVIWVVGEKKDVYRMAGLV